MQMLAIVLALMLFHQFHLQVQSTERLLTNNDWRQNLQHIRSKTPDEVQRQAVLELINRITGNNSWRFAVNIERSESRYFEIVKTPAKPVVFIKASDGVSACKAVYHYLKYVLKCHISWTEIRIEIFGDLPSVHIRRESPSSFIYYQNVCTWGYSFAWWTWHDWRHHIDWMALMGISMSIAPIQEQIWTRVFENFGLNRSEIDEHFGGPAFLPWSRMGNMRGWGGPLSSEYKLRQLKLQKQIIQASRNLGMTIAIPGFAGHVPAAMRRIFPNATFTQVNCWNRFSEQYCCPLFVDPNEEAFRTIGTRFLREVIHEYGSDHLYFIDPFNEVEPRQADGAYLANTSLRIYETIKEVDPNGVWLLQGWMFLDPFWSLNLIQSFLTAVPQGKIIILDLMSETLPMYDKTKSYYGQPFIWCMLHNFGGTLGMHGSIEIVNDRIQDARTTTDTMIGVGITPEGILQNYPVYEFALERGWEEGKFNVSNWFDTCMEARYHKKDKNLEDAWNIILSTVYSYTGLLKLHGKYTINRRPSLKIQTYTWYDPENFKKSLELFLKAKNSVQNQQIYEHDLVDVTRQFLQLVADQLFVSLKKSYTSKNLSKLNETVQLMTTCFNDLEKILASDGFFLLGNWLEKAKQMALSVEEEQNFEFNIRNQITIWGPKGEIVDYASKQWSGIVEDYFLPRWQLFFGDLIDAVKSGKNFSEEKFKQKVLRDVEQPFSESRKTYTTLPKGNSVEIASEIWMRWRNLTINEVWTKNQRRRVFATPTVIQQFTDSASDHPL